MTEIETHPLFESRQHAENDDYLERESNMIVIVEFEDKKYRVDFGKYSEEYQMMPRHIKKLMVLEELRKERDEKRGMQQKTRNEAKQANSKQSMVERLRAKLQQKNPFYQKNAEFTC